MIVTCLSSGSNANSFLLTNSIGEILLLDAGVKLKTMLASKRWTSCSNVVGALITHAHKDHSLSKTDLIKAGINIFSYENLLPKHKYRAGSYELMPFQCDHDGVKNYGYIVRDTVEGKLLVYATDTISLPIVKDVDVWLVECNHNMDKWNENVAKETANLQYFGRLLRSHMSLEYLEKYYKTTAKAPLKAIILCHLSENGNADKEAMTSKLKPYAEMIDVAYSGKEWVL